jgi:hypothetical protein
MGTNMTIREALQDVYSRYGSLTPRMVVDEATSGVTEAGDVLSRHFDWDDRTAADSYRIVQARRLISSVRIAYREPTEQEAARSIRGYVSVQTAEGRAYHPTEMVAHDPFLRQLMLRDAERDWKALFRKHGHLKEFVDMVVKDVDAA